MPSSIVPTTTYPFTFTTAYATYSQNPDLTFATPTLGPSATVVPFPAQPKCCSRWSQYPLEKPFGLNASCVISNDGCTNPDAFWDLYACCNGAYPQAFGSSEDYLCTGTCEAVGQSWQDLMSCLQKRVPVVVCKPAFEEIATDIPSSTYVHTYTTPSESSSTGCAAGLCEATRVPADAASSAAAVSSTGAASAIDVVHVKGTKAGVVVFAILALSSAAGMFL